ncbi:hypothetical protein JCM10207_009241 [Rhodosporidiobolus poonsookiae]
MNGMPPHFLITSPPGAFQSGDIWDEISEREYYGYTPLAPINAATSALTPSAEAPSFSFDGENKAYDSYTPAKSKLGAGAGGDYGTSKDVPYRDYEDGEEGKDAKDWMDKYRSKDASQYEEDEDERR